MSAAQKFVAGISKLEREIAKHAKGEEHENATRLFKKIGKLEDLTNDPELRHTPENEARWEACKMLRQAVRDAEELAFVARQNARSEEISRIQRETPQLSGYEKELALQRGGAYGPKRYK